MGGYWGGHQATDVLLMPRKLRKSGKVEKGRGSVHLCPMSIEELWAPPAHPQMCGPVGGERIRFDFTLF